MVESLSLHIIAHGYLFGFAHLFWYLYELCDLAAISYCLWLCNFSPTYIPYCGFSMVKFSFFSLFPCLLYCGGLIRLHGWHCSLYVEQLCGHAAEWISHMTDNRHFYNIFFFFDRTSLLGWGISTGVGALLGTVLYSAVSRPRPTGPRATLCRWGGKKATPARKKAPPESRLPWPPPAQIQPPAAASLLRGPW